MTHAVPESRYRSFLIVAVVLLAVLAVYGRMLGHAFLESWDDGAYIVANEAAHGFGYDHLRAAFTRTFLGNYAPLHIISYMLDYELWGMRPVGYLLTNLLLHAANGLLLYALLCRLIGVRGALAGVLVFLLHPVQVESVAWLSQRKNLLAMFFFLSAFLCYIGACESRTTRGSARWYAGALCLFVLALLSKSVAVILPGVLLAYEALLRRQDRTGWLLRIAPFCAAAAVAALLALWSQAPEQGGGRVLWWGGSPWGTFCTMLPVLFRYLALLVWPDTLSAVYDPPIRTGADAAVVIAGLGVAALAGAGIWLYRRNRPALFWYLLFFAGLLPVLQVVPLTTLINDRYLYFPLLGVAGLTAAGTARLLSDRSTRIPVWVVLSTLLLSLASLSYSRVGVWRDDISLWSATARTAPGIADVWYNLGHARQVRGALDLALEPYLRALSLQPVHPRALANMAAIFPAGSLQPEPGAVVMELVRNFPRHPHGLFLLGHGPEEWRNLAPHRDLFLKVLRFNPRSGPAWLGLGNVQLRGGDVAGAEQAFLRASAAGAHPGEVAYARSCVWGVAGKYAESSRLLREARAREIDPNLAAADRYLRPLLARPEFAAVAAPK